MPVFQILEKIHLQNHTLEYEKLFILNRDPNDKELSKYLKQIARKKLSPFDDYFKGKIQLIENGSSPIFKVEFGFYDKKDGQCKVKQKKRYSFKDEAITRIGCTETKCSKAGNKKNCRPLKQYSCVGYPPFR